MANREKCEMREQCHCGVGDEEIDLGSRHQRGKAEVAKDME
jgi:hypothetical protein